MAVSDYGAVQSTVIQGVSNAIRAVKGSNSLIAPNQWASNISELNSDADYNHIVSQMIEETATGSITSFTDGANNIPAKEIICHINPTETGTGEKSPQNPYVIGGHTEINVINANKAIVSDIYTIEPIQEGSGTPSPTNVRPIHAGLTIKRDDNSDLVVWGGTLNVVNGELISTLSKFVIDETKSIGLPGQHPTGYSCYRLTKNYNGIPSNFKYYSAISCCDTFETENTSNYTKAKNYMTSFPSGISQWIITISNEYADAEQQTTDANFKLWLENHNITVIYELTTPDVIQLSATELERAKAALGIITHHASFGQTVYGGELNVTTGVLTINRARYNIKDLAQSKTGWFYYSPGGNFGHGCYTNIPQSKADKTITPDYPDGKRPIVCEIAEWKQIVASSNETNYCRWLGAPNNGNLYFNNQYASVSLDAWLDYLQANDVYIWFYIEPYTIQLAPIEVRTLLGANNIYHDCNGDIDVTYRANGALYVEQH